MDKLKGEEVWKCGVSIGLKMNEKQKVSLVIDIFKPINILQQAFLSFLSIYFIISPFFRFSFYMAEHILSLDFMETFVTERERKVHRFIKGEDEGGCGWWRSKNG